LDGDINKWAFKEFIEARGDLKIKED